MEKIVDHIDHAVWLSSPENLSANVEMLEVMANTKLVRFEREDMGFIMYISWAAGIELVCPMEHPTEFNEMLRAQLAKRGEGLMGVVFGVNSLDGHAKRLASEGVAVGPLMDDHVDSPWHQDLKLQERLAGEVMNSWFILGDIDYKPGTINFVDAKNPHDSHLPHSKLKKFVNHVDHVVWLSRPENLEANVAKIEQLSGVKLERCDRSDLGVVLYLSWEAGLEVIAPFGEETEYNVQLNLGLQFLGEGILGVVYGVDHIEDQEPRLKAVGQELGIELLDDPNSPWRHKLLVRERTGPIVMNGSFMFGDVRYPEGMVKFQGSVNSESVDSVSA
ncbi:hypothetical protein [Halioxenophilus sp. WMMB6]|uniref:hypothetical protein n=1 Tax=Halioxenophilus sp. WMMB6 TaxID=3073815 RepID=UPI00295E4274|nr:hypothetical protein [Halioxenophilus sp. WMMB6]